MIFSLLKSNILKRVLGLFGAAGFLLIFQACYGTPQNLYNVSGKISDSESNEGIRDLKLNFSSDKEDFAIFTDENGEFFTSIMLNGITYNLNIEDVDGALNGSYSDIDTVISLSTDPVNIALNQE